MKTLSIITVLIILFASVNITPQQKDSLVMLSSSIGKLVDQNESYKIKSIDLDVHKNFNNAEFYLRNDTLLVVKIKYTNNNNFVLDTSLTYSSSMLNKLRLEVYNVESWEAQL